MASLLNLLLLVTCATRCSFAASLGEEQVVFELESPWHVEDMEVCGSPKRLFLDTSNEVGDRRLLSTLITSDGVADQTLSQMTVLNEDNDQLYRRKCVPASMTGSGSDELYALRGGNSLTSISVNGGAFMNRATLLFDGSVTPHMVVDKETGRLYFHRETASNGILVVSTLAGFTQVITPFTVTPDVNYGTYIVHGQVVGAHLYLAVYSAPSSGGQRYSIVYAPTSSLGTIASVEFRTLFTARFDSINMYQTITSFTAADETVLYLFTFLGDGIPIPGSLSILVVSIDSGTVLRTVSIASTFIGSSSPDYGDWWYTRYTTIASENNGRFIRRISIKEAASVIQDPVFTGFQGQVFQFHGIPDEWFALISTPSFYVNAHFKYLASGSSVRCSDTEPWSHPGTYIDQLSVVMPEIKIILVAGSQSNGFTRFAINNQSVTMSKIQQFRLPNGYIQVHSYNRITLSLTTISIEATNSNDFINVAVSLHDRSARKIGSKIVSTVGLTADEITAKLRSTHAFSFDMHGLLGQTWARVVYNDNQWWRGDVTDYLVHSPWSHEFAYDRYNITEKTA